MPSPVPPPLPELTRTELRRYSRPMLVPEWLDAGAQERVRAAGVLVVGAGGLGGPVALQLAGAGVGRLHIADGDVVEVSNLHRQTHFGLSDVGRSKAQATAARVQGLNPFVGVRALPHVEAATLPDFLDDVDVVVDATDNFESRYLIADACAAARRVYVWGAASGTSGLVSVFGPDGANVWGLRDVFPQPTGAESCDEAGVLGPVPQVVGSMMALEVLKVLGGVGDPLLGRLWTFEALTSRSRVLSLRPEPAAAGSALHPTP